MSKKTLYVRVQPGKPGVTSFFRCGMMFILAWRTLHDVDAATAQRLESEQMLEVTETRPPELDEAAPAGDSAAGLVESTVVVAAPPASAPTSTEKLAVVLGAVAAGLASAELVAGDTATLTADTTAPAATGETALENTSTATTATTAPVTSTKPEDPAAVVAAVKAAIAKLDQGDASLFTAAHKPKTDVLAELTGWPVTAAERDAALGE